MGMGSCTWFFLWWMGEESTFRWVWATVHGFPCVGRVRDLSSGRYGQLCVVFLVVEGWRIFVQVGMGNCTKFLVLERWGISLKWVWTPVHGFPWKGEGFLFRWVWAPVHGFPCVGMVRDLSSSGSGHLCVVFLVLEGWGISLQVGLDTWTKFVSACCRVKSTTSAYSVQKGNIYLTYQRLSVYGYLNVIVCVLKGCVINVCLFSGYGHLVFLSRQRCVDSWG